MCLKTVSDWLFAETDNLATLIGSIFVFCGLWIASRQWSKDQKWKQKEALINRINAFNETPGALNALLMLASSDRNVPLWAKEKVEDRYVRIKREEVVVALIPEKYLPFTFSPKESAIRDSFGDYLIKLSHLEPYMESLLLTEDEAKVIMNNLINTLKKLKDGKEIDKALLQHLYLYIDSSDIYGLKNLLKRFKIDINYEIIEAQNLLQAQIVNGEWVRPVD